MEKLLAGILILVITFMVFLVLRSGMKKQ